MGRIYHDKKWLTGKYHGEDLTIYDIASLCDVNSETIRQWLHRHDIEVRDGGPRKGNGRNRYEELQNREWLYEKYIKEGLGQSEISRIVGCTNRAVEIALERHGIETRDAYDAQRGKAKGSVVDPRLGQKEWLCEKYVEEELTQCEIAEITGTHATTVKYWMDRHGIEARHNGPFKDNDNVFQRDPLWDERREKRLEMDGYECFDCGVSEEDLNRSLDVHHLNLKKGFEQEDGTVNWKMANDTDNLRSLCQSCHLKRHTT